MSRGKYLSLEEARMDNCDHFNRSFEDVCFRQRPEPLLCVSASAAVFWLVLSSALADRRAPRRQSRLTLWAVFLLSLDQPLIRQALSSNAVHKTIKPRKRVVLDVAFIQSESKLVNVAPKMFRTGMVVNANQAALENSENAFHPVGGHVVADEFASAMVDGLMIEAGIANAFICASFICVQHRSKRDMLMDGGLDCLFVGILYRHGNGAAAAFAHTENRRLANRASPGLELLGLMFVFLNAADESFVNFNDAFQLFELRSASLSKPVQHEPSGFLRNTDLFRQLHAGYALASRHEQVHRVNPLVKWNMAALEYRTSAHREVFLALVAAIVTASPRRDALAKAADRAARAVRPQAPFKVGAGRFLVRKHLEKLERRNSALAHGLSNLCPKYRPERRGSQVYNSHSKGIDVPAPECCTAAIAVHSFRSWLWTKWLIGS
jgi:hypothetical protein